MLSAPPPPMINDYDVWVLLVDLFDLDIRERFHYVILMMVVIIRNFSQSGDMSKSFPYTLYSGLPAKCPSH